MATAMPAIAPVLNEGEDEEPEPALPTDAEPGVADGATDAPTVG